MRLSSRALDGLNGIKGFEMITCNTEKFGIGLCGKPAQWKHPRWPTGTYCNEHKRSLETFWPNSWIRLITHTADRRIGGLIIVRYLEII